MRISNDKITATGASNLKGHPSVVVTVALGKNHINCNCPSPLPDLQAHAPKLGSSVQK